MENDMIKIALLATILVLMLGVVVNMSQSSQAQAGKSDDANLAHMVYFSLKDNSPEACQKLVDACKKYLSKHEGEVYFSAGVRAKEFKRDVNDQDFDVALHIVFQSKAAHDKYQDHPRHNEFINENKANWKKVRVFDTTVSR
jgi:Stress responsive A/B Barrel Domain